MRRGPHSNCWNRPARDPLFAYQERGRGQGAGALLCITARRCGEVGPLPPAPLLVVQDQVVTS